MMRHCSLITIFFLLNHCIKFVASSTLRSGRRLQHQKDYFGNTSVSDSKNNSEKHHSFSSSSSVTNRIAFYHIENGNRILSDTRNKKRLLSGHEVSSTGIAGNSTEGKTDTNSENMKETEKGTSGDSSTNGDLKDNSTEKKNENNDGGNTTKMSETENVGDMKDGPETTNDSVMKSGSEMKTGETLKNENDIINSKDEKNGTTLENGDAMTSGNTNKESDGIIENSENKSNEVGNNNGYKDSDAQKKVDGEKEPPKPENDISNNEPEDVPSYSPRMSDIPSYQVSYRPSTLVASQGHGDNKATDGSDGGKKETPNDIKPSTSDIKPSTEKEQPKDQQEPAGGDVDKKDPPAEGSSNDKNSQPVKNEPLTSDQTLAVSDKNASESNKSTNSNDKAPTSDETTTVTGETPHATNNSSSGGDKQDGSDNPSDGDANTQRSGDKKATSSVNIGSNNTDNTLPSNEFSTEDLSISDVSNKQESNDQGKKEGLTKEHPIPIDESKINKPNEASQRYLRSRLI